MGRESVREGGGRRTHGGAKKYQQVFFSTSYFLGVEIIISYLSRPLSRIKHAPAAAPRTDPLFTTERCRATVEIGSIFYYKIHMQLGKSNSKSFFKNHKIKS
jgi:hypothetical protein